MPTAEYSTVIDSDADRAWGVVKQFGAIANWHPAIVHSGIEGDQPDGLPGIVRKLRLQDGGIVRERLLSVDDRSRTLSYRFEEAPLPLDNYVATVRLVPLTGQPRTFIQWQASFEVRSADDAGQYEALIQDLIVTGNDSLQRFLGAANPD